MTDNGVNNLKNKKPTKKELLQQLLDLENENVGDLGISNDLIKSSSDTQNDVKPEENIEINDSIVKPKKKLTEKQLEALRKGQATRDANARKRKEEAQQKAEEERKQMEDKLVKKAIAIKKKELKRQAILDEISDDDTPIQKLKEIVNTKTPNEGLPKPIFKFF